MTAPVFVLRFLSRAARYDVSGITGEHPLCGLLREPDLTVRDGFIRVPEGLGLGIELDDAKLEELQTL